MKGKRTLRLVMGLSIVFSMLVWGIPVSYAEGAEDRYADIFNLNDENVYVMLGDEVLENRCEFLDGRELGITDPSHPLYNELSMEQGLDGRKYYAANYMTLSVDPSEFATDNDNEFWVYITYYDYGPSEGRFYLEYIDKKGAQQTITIVKPGTVQRYNTECVSVNDIDFSKTLANTGGNIRIRTGAYNLFKKIEIVNASKFKRENRSLKELGQIPASAKKQGLIEFKLIDEKSEKFQDSNLKNDCTYGDAFELFKTISNGRTLNNSFGYKSEDVITQRDLLLMAFDVLGLNYGDTSPLDYAKEIKLIEEADFIYSENVTASYYSLAAIVYDVFNFKKDNGSTIMEEMLNAGYWDEDFIKTNRALITLHYKYPRHLPYRTITENATGQTYHYMNILGIKTLRNYVTAQGFNSDATGFICGFDTGELFFYNTETQMLHFIDKIAGLPERLAAVMGTDDYVYYPKMDDENYYCIYKADINTIPAEPQLVARREDGYAFTTPHITNDCKYISVDLGIPGLDTVASRYSIEENEWIDYHKYFTYSDYLTHVLINPEYPDLISFCHELLNVGYMEMLDRMWQVDLGTGEEAENVYKQGERMNGQVMQAATHEVWSNNGEYMYYINVDAGAGNNVGLSPSSVRYNKDGTHRQYFYDHTVNEDQDKHLFPSGDDKFIVADGNAITLISQETHERFPISKFDWMGDLQHPNHAHPTIARNKYVVNWGAYDENMVTGIKWFDFTELAKKQAKGGRYEVGKNLDRISYIGLDSESSEVTYKGRKAVVARKGKFVYLDISDEFLDTVDGKVKISFDYFDNGNQPITLFYTSGVKSDNDRWRVYDNSKTVERTNSNKWKHCEILIDSGNFENIGKHFSDIKITGSPANLYITDLNVSIPK